MNMFSFWPQKILNMQYMTFGIFVIEKMKAEIETWRQKHYLYKVEIIGGDSHYNNHTSESHTI